MLARVIYTIQKILRLLGNLRRRLGKPPDYVVFVLEGPYPELPEPRAGFLRRRLFPRKQSLAELAGKFGLKDDQQHIVLGHRQQKFVSCRKNSAPMPSSSVAMAMRAGN